VSVDYSIVPKGSVILSVSQIKTGKACLRKNYLEKVSKLPVIFAASTTRGSILHECVERWLLHKDQLKPGTQTFNDVLYPHEWYVKEEKGQRVEIDQEERDWIRYIIPQAINERLLLRDTTREVEWQFLEELIPAEGDKPAVWIVGYIDLCEDNRVIIDHKTCKNFRWTLNEDQKDPKKFIGYDIQLNVYAYFWAMENLKRGTPLPETVRLKHIQYGYEDRRVKTAQAVRSWESVLDVMDQVKDQARTIRDSRSIIDHMEVDHNPSNCGAYGGCPYSAICGGMEEPEDYKERIENSIKANNELREAKRKHTQMSNSRFDSILGDMAQQTKESTAPVTKVEAPKEEPKTEPKTEAPAPKVIEPKDAITKADIVTCMTQLETNMAPMGIDVNSIPAYQELQGKLDVILDAEQAEKRAKAKAEAEAKAKAEAEAKADAVVETTPVEEKAPEVVKPTEYRAAEPTNAELAPTKDNKTNLRKGFVLLINATSNSYGKFVNIGTIYADVADKVRAHNGELSAAQVHATVIASASDIASKMLVGHCVNAPTMNDVHRDLANELIQYADVVVYGVQPS
jgi:hypothetical protein